MATEGRATHYSAQEATNQAYTAVRVAASGAIYSGRALHCNTDGTYYCRFRADSARTKLVLNAGVTYPFSVTQVSISPTSAIAPTASTDIIILP